MLVLYIDDSFEDFELAKNALRELKEIQMVYAESYEKFKEKFHTEKFSIILSDYNMPDVLGVDVFSYVRSFDQDVPFIIISGALGEELAVEILRMGVTDYVMKDKLLKLPLVVKRVIKESTIRHENKMAQRLIVESEEKYRSVVEDQTEFIVRYAPSGKILFANSSYLAFLNMTNTDLIGLNYFELLKSQDQSRAWHMLSVDNPCISNTYSFKKNGNKKIWQEWVDRAFYTYGGKIVEYQSVGRDVSEQRISEMKIIRNEKKLAKINSELERLTNYLQLVREEERTKIARDIHDELGQLLAGLKMQMNSYRTKLIKNNTNTEEVEVMLKLVDEAVGSIHEIAADLRPKMLDDLGLFSTLEWNVEKFLKVSNFKINLTINCEEEEFATEFSNSIYRIFQESLTNCAKHSQAKRIDIDVNRVGNDLQIIIKDDGSGFNEAEVKSKNSFGLIGMKERAKLIKGKLEIISTPGKGTTIKLSAPIIKK